MDNTSRKGKHVVSKNKHKKPLKEVSSNEKLTSIPPYIDYNVLSHLWKLFAKLSIYDALI